MADDTPNSRTVIANLTGICERHFPNRYEIEIIDVLRQPERALAAGIFVTPTVVKYAPPPTLEITGTLGDWETTLKQLELPREAR